MGVKAIETDGRESGKKKEAGMGKEEDTNLQRKYKDKTKRKMKEKKKEKGESVESDEERLGKLKQGKKRKAVTGDLVTDIETCSEKNTKNKKKKMSEDFPDDTEGNAVTGEEKKQKKKKLKSTDLSDGVEVEVEVNEESGKSGKKKKANTESVSNCVGDEANTSEKVEKGKKKKLKSKAVPDDVEVEDEAARESGKSKKINKMDTGSISNGVGDEAEEVEQGKKKNKKKKSRDISCAGDENKGQDDDAKKKKKKEKKAKSGKGEKGAENSTAKISSKRVSFADNLEVFDEVPNKKARPLQNKGIREGLVQGKRFTREEDDMIKEAVSKYIEEHNLGENGIDMIMNCRFHKEIKHCWKEIAEAIPHRPKESVYYRTHIIYERADTSKWTAEEKEYVKEFYKKHGADWRTLATELNKHRFHVKEAWRRNRLENENHGRWSQQEYQSLFDLVNKDLSIRALEERKSQYGMIRDNIPWDAISNTLGTRHTAKCCLKWYKNLTSPLVAEGLWSDTDDYRLVNALLELDASNIDEVMWEYLLEHRDGETARKRWNQMVKHIGEYSKLSFSQQVEVLGQRYSPKFIPAREDFDSKPFVDC